MIQLALWEDILPKEVKELQYQWVKAIKNRIGTEKTNIYEIIDGEICPVFLSEKYYESREREMLLFVDLADFCPYFKAFTGVEEYLHL